MSDPKAVPAPPDPASEDDLRYPIGRFAPPSVLDAAARGAWMARLAAAPSALRRAVAGLDEAQLDTPYRPGGWTVRQVVHHLPDSHLNSYLRFRWALTEPTPTARAYDERAWAELPDASHGPVAPSLALFEALHARWALLLDAMGDDDFERAWVHPQTGAARTLAWTLGLYAWHGEHHVAHIVRLRERRGW